MENFGNNHFGTNTCVIVGIGGRIVIFQKVIDLESLLSPSYTINLGSLASAEAAYFLSYTPLFNSI